jgi:N-acetylglucosamine-6-sulfatase
VTRVLPKVALAAATVAIGTVLVGVSSASALATGAVPNVVIILSDDQPVGTVGRMPYVGSKFKRRAVFFRNAMVPTSNCCPSRASLLTGLFPHTTRVLSNAPPHGGWPVFHDRGLEDRTIAVALHEAGYRTGLIGKYMNHFLHRARAGYVPPGWDTFLTFTGHVGYYNYGLTNGQSYGRKPRDYSTDVLRRAAVRFINSVPSEQPLFLYFAPFGPHRPSLPAPRHEGSWSGRLPSYHPPSVTAGVDDKPPWIRALAPQAQSTIDATREDVQETLMSVDGAVKAIVQALAQAGRISNTLVIYTSDNGVLMGDHHVLQRKNLPYDRSTRVPMLVRWHAHTRPGTTDRRLALNVDIAATVAGAAGIDLPTEGLSLLGSEQRGGFPVESARRGRSDSPPDRPAYCGYRTPNWMYVRYASGDRELYSYKRDPWEIHNLESSRRFRTQLRSLKARAKASCSPVPPGYSWRLR